MTHKELRIGINSYLRLFKKRQYVTEMMFTTVRHVTSAQQVTVLDKMQKFDLIKPINRLGSNGWELTAHGHEVIKYFTWNIYLIANFIKGLVRFIGGLWTIAGTIGTLVFGYLTYTKDNRLGIEVQLNKTLEQKLTSTTNALDSCNQAQSRAANQDILKTNSTSYKK